MLIAAAINFAATYALRYCAEMEENKKKYLMNFAIVRDVTLMHKI